MRTWRSWGITVLLATFLAACGGGSPAGSAGRDASVAGASNAVSAAPSTSPDASDPEASPAASATPKPVAAVKGDGFVDSKEFTLKAGNYVVRWRLTSTATAGCNAIGAIHTPDGQTSVEIANTSVKGKASRSGSKSVPKLPAGTYVVTFATTCSWTANVFRA